MNMSQHQLRTAIEQHEAALIAYCCDFVGYHNACDVVQEAFIELYKHNRPIRHQRAWLFKVSRNKSIDLLRKEGRMHELEDDITETQKTTQPLAQLGQHETMKELRQAVSSLPLRQQEILRLKFNDDMSYKEIADITGLTVSNVGFILHAVLKSLRNHHLLKEATA